jgi:hypothetical protein
VREFRDNEGRPWRLALTVAAALRVRDMVTVEVDQLDSEGEPTGQRKPVPFDLVDVGTISQTFTVLRGQFAKIAEVLYAVLVKQVEEKKLTKEQFFEGLQGDALDAGAKALEQELVDFFPQRLRKMIGLLAAKMDEMAGELMAKAEAGLEQIKAEDLPGMQSGKPQESSESIPESGPSDSLSLPGKAASSTTGGTPPI